MRIPLYPLCQTFLIALITLFYSCSNPQKEKGINEPEQSTVPSACPTVSDLCDSLYQSYTAPRADDGQVHYPDYFGGCYTDNENLIVLIKGDLKTGQQAICRRIGKSGLVKFQSCLFSLEELQLLKAALGEKYDHADLRTDTDWTSVSISVTKNRVIVYLKDCSAKNIKIYKEKISDSDMILFEELSDITIL